MIKRLSVISAGIVFTCFGLVAQAAHDDTTLRRLTVTVSATTGSDVTVDIAGTGIDSDSLTAARLGSQFYFNSYLVNWNNPVPPAIDWGDGNTVANTAIPFTGSNTAPTTTFFSNPTFSGQFMHTYAAPGAYTIRVFGSNVYANSSEYSIKSGTYSVTSPSIYYGSYSTNSHGEGSVPIGITNTTTVSITGAAPPVAAAIPVPTLSNWVVVLLGMVLAGFGLVTLRRA